MAKRRNAELLQIGIGQVRQDALIDVILDERTDILRESQLLEPLHDVRHPRPTSSTSSTFVTQNALSLF